MNRQDFSQAPSIDRNSGSATIHLRYTYGSGSVGVAPVEGYPTAHFHENEDRSVTWHPDAETRCERCPEPSRG